MADPALPLPKNRADRRKLYVYGGVAVALLIVIMLRRNAASSQQAPADPNAGQLTPVSNAAPTDSFGGAVGGDNGAQLAGFENALFDQLPQAIESGIAAGFANYVPAPAPAGVGDPTTPSPTVTFDPASFLTAAAGLINVGTGLAGASNAAAKSGPASTNVKAIPHPAVVAPSHPAVTVATHGETPGAKYKTKENVTRHGVIGELHIYPDHEVFVPRHK